MKITIESGLPYVEAVIVFNGKQLNLNKAIIDTGSAASIFKADKVAEIGLLLEPNDEIHRICGVGGSEFVFTKKLEKLQIEDLSSANFQVEIGAMDYGFDIDGIIGMDFLLEVKAVIDLAKLEIHSQQ